MEDDIDLGHAIWEEGYQKGLKKGYRKGYKKGVRRGQIQAVVPASKTLAEVSGISVEEALGMMNLSGRVERKVKAILEKERSDGNHDDHQNQPKKSGLKSFQSTFSVYGRLFYSVKPKPYS